MKKVAIIQNGDFFTPDLQDKYLKNITLFYSDDVEKVYNFIIKNARKKDIFKFVLDINSGLLEELMDYVSLKKKSKSCSKILKKCTFVATRSNADNIRQKENLKDMNLYFTLTPIGEILKNYSDNRMFIVSNSPNPFFSQIYNFKSNNYRISELTVDILNNYKGHAMTCAFNSDDEYKRYVELVLQSNYRKIVQFIEVSYLGILKPLGDIMFSFGNINAGSGLVGNMLEYPELNEFKVYENTSLMLAYHHNQWNSFIKNKIISRKNMNYGKLITYLNTNDFK